MAALRLRESVIAAKQKLATDREKLKRQHQAGTPGVQLCAQITDCFDSILLELVNAAADDVPGFTAERVLSNVTIVPHGGYGRRDTAPYSDIDLMILHAPTFREPAIQFTKRLQQDVFDVGLILGHSLRTPKQAISAAMSDATIFTSLAENRFLAGSVGLFRNFAEPFRRRAKRNFRSLYHAIMKSRDEERAQYGEIVHLLEPNIKRSSGALRGIQMVRWLGFAKFGENEMDSLNRLGAISDRDRKILRDAREYLLRLRNELHFHAGKSSDLLDRAEQIRIAELYGFQGTEGLLPVEQFMQTYFEQTSGVRDAARHFIASIRPQSPVATIFGPIMTRRVDRDFHVGPYRISTSKRWKQHRAGQIDQILELMIAASRFNRQIDHPTWEVIRSKMHGQGEIEMTEATRRAFLTLLSEPGRLGQLLRRLHELRLLEKIVPGMSHARCLLQFNQYHKYTVDAHCIKTVECATQFLERDDTLGAVYMKIKKKWLLHLALLIHDLGKGFSEDHSIVGARIAEDVADRFWLSPQDKETLVHLVLHHLKMSHLAFRRDTSDEQLVLSFAMENGPAERMRMLFVLTCADFAGVGPGTLNDWKVRVLTDLYRKSMQNLGGDDTVDTVALRRKKLDRLAALVRGHENEEWYRHVIDTLPEGFLQETPATQIVSDLEQLHAMKDDSPMVACQYREDRGVLEITIGTRENLMQGVFHRLTAAVTSQRMTILAAEINTLADGLVLDRYFVQDQDHDGQSPQERMDDICGRIHKYLTADEEQAPSFTSTWTSRNQRLAEEAIPIPTEIKIDNETSDQYTIVEVFTQDRQGLLYQISRMLFDIELSVHVARITTHLDQVVDVFYVTDSNGNKIFDDQRLASIKQTLGEALVEQTS
ncbi:[protein-PII] uridylyltransferase [Bremerella sp. JC770]|uniref:[protein-PII] uridylyltransferase n=1 Tax=Bremerella sp. JC770 TaxID=3232137 RepID=UPI003458579C